MNNVTRFLKVLQKIGYPNSSVPMYAKLSDYDLDDFLTDLTEEIGVPKSNDFVLKALHSLYEGDKGIRVDLDVINAVGAYAYIMITDPIIDLDESSVAVPISWKWGDTHIATVDENSQDEWKTITEAWEDVDMGEWNEFDNFIDEIKDEINEKIYNNCGFSILL